MPIIRLPFRRPPLTSFLRWVYTLGIVCAHDEAEGWILNNFIQLRCTRRYGLSADSTENERQMILDVWRGPYLEMFGTNNPFLDFRALHYDSTFWSVQAGTVVELSTLSIERGFYPVLFLDESKLSYSTQFGSGEFYPHHVMLRAVDSDSGGFEVVGLGKTSPTEEYGRLGDYRITNEELRSAAASMEAGTRARSFAGGLSVLLRYRPPGEALFPFETEPRLDLIKAAINEYVNCTEPLTANALRPNEQVYGAAVFPELVRYFHQVTEQLISGKHRRDVRHLHVLEEHHRLMASRITALSSRGLIPDTERATQVASQFQELATALQLQKLRVIKNYHWQAHADFRWLGQQLTTLGERSRRLMERALLLM